MRPAGQILVAAASRLYAPLLVLFSLTLFAGRHASFGVAFLGGLVFGLAPLLHALTFGAVAARAAFPPFIARLLLSGGVLAVLAGYAMGGGGASSYLTQGGAFAAAGATAVLIMTVLIGRAPTLLDADW